MFAVTKIGTGLQYVNELVEHLNFLCAFEASSDVQGCPALGGARGSLDKNKSWGNLASMAEKKIPVATTDHR